MDSDKSRLVACRRRDRRTAHTHTQPIKTRLAGQSGSFERSKNLDCLVDNLQFIRLSITVGKAKGDLPKARNRFALSVLSPHTRFTQAQFP